ncbi:MAG TPA: chromosomal replication initiator protein DnaA [Bacillota bacterium]|jgi:chromosomal replication initiator protein
MKDQLIEIWDKALAAMERDLPRAGYETWLKGTHPLALHDDTMVIGVPNDFAREWLETKYSSLIKRTLKGIVGYDMAIRFVHESGPAASAADEVASTWATPQSAVPTINGESIGQPLNPRYTFDRFVVGNSNRFAHAASQAVAGAPARAYNPLFIYGGVGLGKTHLMQAAGHYIRTQGNGMRVVYISSETFTNELISSIRDRTQHEFRNRYRTIDVLLVDDIQFLAGKEATQEEFFHTFNSLHEANRQIVISSDRPPKEITALEERLRSRFEWGLIADIQPPDLETRVAILRKKAEIERLEIPNDVMLFIASKIDTNIRELEGALIRIIAYASLISHDVTIDVAAEALKDILPQRRPKTLSIELIQQRVAAFYGLRVDDLKAQRRTRALAFPRQIAMYISRELTDSSLPRIGEEFGGRDHTTVIHAYEKVAADMKVDASLRSVVQELMEKLRNG